MNIRPTCSPKWARPDRAVVSATVDALRRAALARLSAHGDSPALDARLLLEHVLGVNHSWLVMHGQDVVPPAARQRFDALVERRAAGEPLAYIIGSIGFWTLELSVTPDVLIPRPDTETLVEAVLEEHDAAPRRLLDLGTGSGAIALALAAERPAWAITATDASPQALACARSNAARLGLTRVEFALGPWFQAVGDGRFDIIVSNPPYIDADDAHLGAPELKHEPQAALVAPDNGLADLQHIVAAAPRHLGAGGCLYLEHGAEQGPAVRSLLRDWARVETIVDLGHNDRVTRAVRPDAVACA